MSQQKELSDAQIRSRLARRKSPATAADLGLPLRGGAARLRSIEGVVEVGRQHTGKAGRPAALFTVSERVPDPSDEGSTDPAAQSRDGSLNEQVISE